MPRIGTIFRPNAQLALWVRLDEGADTGPLEGTLGRARDLAGAPSGPDVAGAPPDAAALAGLEDELDQAQTQIELLQLLIEQSGETPERVSDLDDLRARREAIRARIAGTGDANRPEIVDGMSPDSRYVRAGILPAKVEIERNGFRTADTATIEIAWRDAPFDPRMVRAAAVEVVIGVVDPADFAAGMAGQRDPETGQLRSIVRQNLGGAIDQGATRFVGWVDNWDVDYDGEAGNFVTLECRDNTALFLDTPLASGDRVDLNLPIDEGIRALCDRYPTLSGIRVVYGDTWETNPGIPPTPGTAVAPEQRTGGRGGSGRARHPRTGDQRMNLWDYITDLCVQVGVIPIVRDYELRIVNPRTAFSGPGSGPGGRPRRMVFGKNLSNLHTARKLGGVKVPTIEVRAYDPGIARTRWARWPVRAGERTNGILGVTNPPRALRANETGVSGANPDERIQTFVVRYGSDPERLSTIARGLYEQIGRQEVEGSFKTSNVTSFEIEDEADLLRIQSGDPVEILLAPSDRAKPVPDVSTVGDITALSTQARAAFLRELGWSDEVALRFAQLQEEVGFAPIFRTQNARILFDAETGLEIDVDFINYIVVRDDVEVPVVALDEVTITAGPSEEILVITGDRTDEASEDARAASAERRSMDPDNPEIEGALEEERDARIAAESSGGEEPRTVAFDEPFVITGDGGGS